jgi:hypothetical protein
MRGNRGKNYGKRNKKNEEHKKGKKKFKSHNGNPQPEGNLKCERCGKSHLTKDCFWVTGSCFGCGKTGHRVNDCPHKKVNSDKGKGVVQGRVYAITTEQVQDSGVVTGTTSLNH